jgi:large subunit ribosomal protein L19
MRNKLIEAVESEYLKQGLPELRIGDTVSVSVRIKEGTKERIQKFDGTLIAMSGAGTNKTFTIRKISSGVGVERAFLLNSPLIDKIVVTSKGRAIVRRAKLYYLRHLTGKKTRITYKAN